MKKPSHLAGLPKQFTVPLGPDEDGWVGRACPEQACGRYFKITPGTGLEGIDTCRCPYCGHQAHGSRFLTEAQREHAMSVVKNAVLGAVLKDMKAMEFDRRSRGMRISMKVTGRAPRIVEFSEVEVETEIVCGGCELRYAIYGVFGYCPDCGAHNNLTTLDGNLRLATRMLDLADDADPQLQRALVEDALENCVAAFDGWARTVCAIHAAKATSPKKAAKLGFQNVERSHRQVLEQFGFDTRATLGPSLTDALHRWFQKRHVLAHAMGVVDQRYLNETKDPDAVLGHRVAVDDSEVRDTAAGIRQWANALWSHLETLV